MNILLKFNIKHLATPFVLLVLLVALNVNTFAISSYSVNFYDSNFVCTAKINGNVVNVTNSCKLTEGKNPCPLNNRHYVVYSYSNSLSEQTSIATGADLGLYTNTQYKYDFAIRFMGGLSSTHNRKINVFITFSNDSGDGDMVQLFSAENVNSEWINCSGAFVTPNLSGNVVCAMVIQLAQVQKDGANTNNFICNLSDMSISIDSELYGESISTPDDSKLEEVIGDYNDISDQLPKFDKDQIDGILNFDFKGFTDGMQFVRDLFDRTTATLGITSVIIFALSIGLVTYILGRRVT